MVKKKQSMQKAEKQGNSSSVGIYLVGIVAVVAVVAVVILIQNAKGDGLSFPSASDGSDSVTGLASAGNIEFCLMKARENGVLIEKKLWNPRTARSEVKNNLKSSEVTNYLVNCRNMQKLKKNNLNVDTTGNFGIKGSKSMMG